MFQREMRGGYGAVGITGASTTSYRWKNRAQAARCGCRSSFISIQDRNRLVMAALAVSS
jgi:hypothetical protein